MISSLFKPKSIDGILRDAINDLNSYANPELGFRRIFSMSAKLGFHQIIAELCNMRNIHPLILDEALAIASRHYSACKGGLDTVKLLVRLGANIRCFDSSPIRCAIQTLDHRLLRYFCEVDRTILNDYSAIQKILDHYDDQERVNLMNTY